MTPQSKTAFQTVTDAANKVEGDKIVHVLITQASGAQTDIAPTPVVPPPPPVPPKPPAPVTKFVTQADNVFANDITSGDFSLTDYCVNQGGIVRYRVAGGNLKLTRVWSEGAPGAGGIYGVIVASPDPNHPNAPGAASCTWDNTGLIDKWMCGGPDGAARFMGKLGKLTIINVDFVTRLHDPTDGGTGAKIAPIPQLHPLRQPTPPNGATYVLWKQGNQLRDIGVFTMTGTLPTAANPDGCGRVVGLLDIGAQAGDEATQRVGDGTITHYGLQNLPHLTSSYGTIRVAGCWKCDANGRAIRDAHGVLQMWPDQVWHGK